MMCRYKEGFGRKSPLVAVRRLPEVHGAEYGNHIDAMQQVNNVLRLTEMKMLRVSMDMDAQKI
jgi:hypothetical protein